MRQCFAAGSVPVKNVAAAFELRLIVLRLHENKQHVNTKLGSSLTKKLVTLYKLLIG